MPGHIGIKGNEEADIAAKTGAQTKVSGPEPFSPIPRAEVEAAIEESFAKQANDRWHKEKRFRQTKKVMPTIKSRWKRTFLSLGRRRLREVIQMITGHCVLRRHRFISHKAESPRCTKCKSGEEEMPEHFVAKCEAFKAQRYEVFKKDRVGLKEIILAGNFKLLCQYIKATKRFEETL